MYARKSEVSEPAVMLVALWVHAEIAYFELEPSVSIVSSSAHTLYMRYFELAMLLIRIKQVVQDASWSWQLQAGRPGGVCDY